MNHPNKEEAAKAAEEARQGLAQPAKWKVEIFENFGQITSRQLGYNWKKKEKK